jgi:hypothetical protein
MMNNSCRHVVRANKVRRLTPSNLAASVSDRPKDFRHFEKSAPLIGNCSSAIPRSVELERSRRPHFVSIGQATPMPSSNISSFAKVSASSISGAKCSLRAINPVRARTYARRSPAKRTCRVRLPAGRTFVTMGISPIIPAPFGTHSTAATTAPDSLESRRRASARTLFGASPAINSPFARRIFAAKSRPVMCTCGGFSS